MKLNANFSVVLLTLITSTQALAHSPVCRCELNKKEILCEGAFHDGSEAQGVNIKLVTYTGNTLSNDKFGKDSSIRFPLPAEPFYILMNAGPGEMFEVDWRDIEGVSMLPGGQES